MDDRFLQVADVADVATPHPHVDHSRSLPLGDLPLRFAFLLRKRRWQQLVIMLNKVHEQHWGQTVSKWPGAIIHGAYWLGVDLGSISHSRTSASRCLVRQPRPA